MSLRHNHVQGKRPHRVVVLGAGGVIGKALVALLQKSEIPHLSLTRTDVDLLEKNAAETLLSFLDPQDSVVFLTTITPDKGKGIEAFTKNILIGEAVCSALEKRRVSHVVYLSSDTVYPLDRGVLSETSATEPENIYGAMHLSREYMVKSLGLCTAILRSTLVYSPLDTHNSYGPNRMRRAAHQNKKIQLFGNGEERRDHIYVEDVANLILLSLLYKSEGTLNLATGNSISYFELAQKVVDYTPFPVDLIATPRANPITHRHFDITSLYKAFPHFRFTPLEKGLKEAYEKEYELVTRI